jgi:hypothetical protein
MSKRDPVFKPPSLTQHFEAPDEFVGHFGWLCGYSADVGFLDSAAERFTRRTTAQRAYEGRVALALMIDPGHPQIQPKDVPGVLHLPIKGDRPFRLLHAKVALLGFRHAQEAKRWRLRLIVSTGNWTRETLEESLDLVWCIDISKEDLKDETDAESVSAACADFAAAWSMLWWLQKFFDDRTLRAEIKDRPRLESPSKTVEKWITKVVRAGREGEPRFFDNRSDSLQAQLPELVKSHSPTSSRNYLALGSGFFESGDGQEIPSVLARVVEELRDAGLLTKGPEIDVFVNPKACQAVATSAPAMTRAGWKVRPPGQPSYFNSVRTLHAKFIFSAFQKDTSALCNSAWLYLGSGNLTGPGFANPMSPQGGNLEAGVLFGHEGLRWTPAKSVPPECVLTNLLPIQRDTDFSLSPAALAPGTDMPEPQLQYSAAPVAYLLWAAATPNCWLRVDEMPEAFEVLDAVGLPCPRDPVNGFSWSGPRPRQVQVCWRADEQTRQAWVPVIDEFGRVAATTLPKIELDEAWGQLANFPMPPDDEELQPDGDDEPRADPDQVGGSGFVGANYPVRQLMQLVENIAAKQTAVAQADWTMWCQRFEQCLTQAAESPILAGFLSLGLNPLSPLWHGPFRPDFAASAATDEGRCYEEALKRVEAAWKVTGLCGLGDES